MNDANESLTRICKSLIYWNEVFWELTKMRFLAHKNCRAVFPSYSQFYIKLKQTFIPTFFLNFPLMWHNLFTPSKHIASNRPFPNILITWAYSEGGKKSREDILFNFR